MWKIREENARPVSSTSAEIARRFPVGSSVLCVVLCGEEKFSELSFPLAAVGLVGLC